MTQSQRTYWCSKGQSMLSESFERWQSACSKWSFQPPCVNYSETVWGHKQGTSPVTTSTDKHLRLEQDGTKQWNDKKLTFWCPVKADFKQEQNTKPSSEKQQQRKSYTKPRVYVPICTSKQIRYNLLFIKCTVCIVQDKVVKVAKLSGPVRLWDFWVGGHSSTMILSLPAHKRPHITCDNREGAHEATQTMPRCVSGFTLSCWEVTTLVLAGKPHLISLHQDTAVWK